MAGSSSLQLYDFISGIGTAGAILQVDNANQKIGIGTTARGMFMGIAITMDDTAMLPQQPSLLRRSHHRCIYS